LRGFNARAWLEYAREDLDAAEILFREGFYRHALFWVEQASEKTLKVYIIGAHSLEDILAKLKMLDVELYNKLRKFVDPKIFGHICKEEKRMKLMEFFDRFRHLMQHPLARSIISSPIKEKIESNEKYAKVFRDIERLIGEAVKSVRRSMPTCKEPEVQCVIEKLKTVEERVEEVENVIDKVREEALRRYGGEEQARQAIEDACHVYACFVENLASVMYVELHMYLCQFFEATRYPGVKGIPNDLIETLPQIVDLLRRNLERVNRIILYCNSTRQPS